MAGSKIKKADELWKEIIEDFFPYFLEFFHPTLYRDIDFSKGYRFLDKEFNTIKTKSSEKRRFVDKLVQVYLKDQSEKWILVHIEIQGYKEEEFPLRMFVYFYRIFDKYRKKIVSLAILTDPYKEFKPNMYDYSFYGTELTYKYNISKITEYDESYLKNSKNIFSLVVLSARYAQRAKNDDDQKLRFTRELIRLMYEKGKTKDEIVKLFKFITGLLYIADPMKQGIIIEDVREIEEVRKVKYVSYVEEYLEKKGLEKGMQKGLQQGLEKGLQQGLQQGLETALKIKFGQNGVKFYKQHINEKISVEKLKRLLEKIEEVETLDELLS